MQITFLVGNGFDIASGVDTSYGAFYKWYCSKSSEKEHINKFKNEIKDDIKNGGKNWADFELGLGQYTKHFTVDNATDFLECYEDAHEMIIKFLEEQKSKFDLDGITSEEFVSFKNGLINFYQDLNPQEINTFNIILEADKGNNEMINFLSFNYTNTLNYIVNELAKTPLKQWSTSNGTRKMEVNKKIIHMHGTSTEYPILGVDNASQIANQDLLSIPNFAEIMIKPQSVNAIGQLWHNEAQATISKSTIIGVFGMSLGESDAKWWTTIIKWLKENASRHLIVFWYTKNPPNGISVFRKLEETKKAKDTLFKYFDLSPSDVKNIESRIHIAINTKNVLNINLKSKDITSITDEEKTVIWDGGEILPQPSTFESYDGVGKKIVVV